MNKRYQGVTLLETLYGLMIMVLISSFFVGLIDNLHVYQMHTSSQTEIKWQLFLTQLENETAGYFLKMVTKDTIILSNEEEELVIEHYQNMIRKRKNNLGHQPLLLEVKNVSFQLTQQTLNLKVTLVDDSIKEGNLVYEEQAE